MLNFLEWLNKLTKQSTYTENYHLPDDECNIYDFTEEELIHEVSDLDFSKRIELKDTFEADIRRALKQIGFIVKKEGGKSADMDKKVDAKIGIDKVQFKQKVVKTDKDGKPLVDVNSPTFKPSDTFFAEAIINYDNDKIPVEKYLNKQTSIGRDLRTESKWFYILNERKDKVYKVHAEKIRKFVRNAIQDVAKDPAKKGILPYPDAAPGQKAQQTYETTGGYKLQVKYEITPRKMWKILVLFPFMEKAEKVYNIPPITLDKKDDGYDEAKGIKIHPDMLTHGYTPPESKAETPAKPLFLTNPRSTIDMIRKLVYETGKATAPIKTGTAAKSPKEQLQDWEKGIGRYGIKIKIEGPNFIFENE
jgi:hypothetical protein